MDGTSGRTPLDLDRRKTAAARLHAAGRAHDGNKMGMVTLRPGVPVSAPGLTSRFLYSPDFLN